jgi:hypothetical protein
VDGPARLPDDQRAEIVAAARDMGIVPGDPAYSFVQFMLSMAEAHAMEHRDHEDRLQRLLAQAEKQAEKQIAEINTFTAIAQQAANRPLMTSYQIKYDVLPALLGAFKWSQVIIGVLLLLGAVGVGMGIEWLRTPIQPTLTCQDERGGVACGYWKVAPTQPADVTQGPQSKATTRGQ